MTVRSNVAVAFGILALAVTMSARQQTTQPPKTVPPVVTPSMPGTPAFPTLPPRSTGIGTRDPLTAIIGQVVDTNGRPVPKAAVRMIADRVMETVLTDPKGRFAFTSIPLGEIVITAEKFGYFNGGYGQRRATGMPLPFYLPYGKVISDMKIEVYRGSIVTGSVRDEAGEPIVGAHVYASRRQFDLGEWQYIAVDSEDTDDQGFFRIFGLLPGEYIMSVGSAPVAINQQGEKQAQDRERPSVYSRMYYPQAYDRTLALPVLLAAGDVRYGVNFSLPPVTARRVTGRLIGPAAATAGQTVKLVPFDASWAKDETASTTSEADGTFVFEAVPEGRYRVQAGNITPRQSSASNGKALADAVDAARGYCGQVVLTVKEGDAANVDIEMMQSAAIVGHIELVQTGGQTVAPVRSVTVSIEPVGPGLSHGTRINMAPDVPFALTNLVPGSYFVRVGALPAGWSVKSIEGGSDAFDHPVDLTHEDVNLTIALADRGTEIIGTVRDNRMQAASGAAIVILPAGMTRDAWLPNRVRETRTSVTGVFTVRGLPPGNYLVIAIDEASADGWQDERILTRLMSLATRFTVHETETVSLVLQITR